MWHLLKLYVAAIREVARLAMLMALAGTSVMGVIMLIPGLSWLLGCWMVASFVPTLLSIYGIKLPPFIAFVSFISALIYLPALTWTATLVLLTASFIFGFIQLFDMLVKPKLGAGYSIQKVLRNPWGRLEAMRLILEKLPIAYNDYLNFLNDAEPGTAHYLEATLDLAEEDMSALVARQTAAIAALPEDFKQLYQEVATRSYTEVDSGSLIEEKIRAYGSYQLETLSFSQRNALNDFLRTVLNLTHATCPITQEPFETDHQNDFLILEKRYQDEHGLWHAIPNSSEVFSKEFDGRDPFLACARFEINHQDMNKSKWSFVHPTTADPIFTPRQHAGNPTQYRRYAYQTIDGYPLSLQVCEAMEAFNHSLNRELGSSASNVTSTRTWPAAGATSLAGLSSLNMHSGRSRTGSDASSVDLEGQYDDEDVIRPDLENRYGRIAGLN